MGYQPEQKKPRINSAQLETLKNKLTEFDDLLVTFGIDNPDVARQCMQLVRDVQDVKIKLVAMQINVQE